MFVFFLCFFLFFGNVFSKIILTTSQSVSTGFTTANGYGCLVSMSPNGNIIIQKIYQNNNLVLVWSSNTLISSSSFNVLLLQNDNNLVLYNNLTGAIWSTGIDQIHLQPLTLTLGTTCALYLIDNLNTILWQTPEYYDLAPSNSVMYVRSTQLPSVFGHFYLTLQPSVGAPGDGITYYVTNAYKLQYSNFPLTRAFLSTDINDAIIILPISEGNNIYSFNTIINSNLQGLYWYTKNGENLASTYAVFNSSDSRAGNSYSVMMSLYPGYYLTVGGQYTGNHYYSDITFNNNYMNFFLSGVDIGSRFDLH